MRKFPKQFEAFCAIWDIEQPDVLLNEDDMQLLGQYCTDDTIIEIAKLGLDGKKLKPRDRWETLWHEIVHVLDATIHHDDNDKWGHSEIDMIGRLLAQITWSMK